MLLTVISHILMSDNIRRNLMSKYGLDKPSTIIWKSSDRQHIIFRRLQYMSLNVVICITATVIADISNRRDWIF